MQKLLSHTPCLFDVAGSLKPHQQAVDKENINEIHRNRQHTKKESIISQHVSKFTNVSMFRVLKNTIVLVSALCLIAIERCLRREKSEVC
jgi:hypothetical protein